MKSQIHENKKNNNILMSKTLKSICIALVLFTMSVKAQITKGNWMVGGNADFSTNKSSDKSSSTVINLTPNVGYFFIDKLSVGTMINYYLAKSKFEDANGKYETLNLGPFIRYYILQNEKRTNFFIESSYNFSLKQDNKNTLFASKLGVAVFLNSSVAFESFIKYSRYDFKYENNILPDSYTNGLSFGIGLQIHLIKEK